MKTRIVCLLLLAITACIFIGVALVKVPQPKKTTQATGKLSVLASFYPLAYFAQSIGGDLVTVQNITPTGTEPHDFEPTPQELVSVYNSKLFIYNGAGLESWVDKVLPDIQSKGIAIVKASNGIDILGGDKQPDPHIWLDPVLAQRIVLNIRDGLIQADPKNSSVYTQNANSLIVKLIDLDQQYQKNLYNCQQKDVVASHQVFAYLSKRYNFQPFAITGLSPDQEPSPQTMADLTNLIQEKKVKYVLTETLVSTKLADTLAAETGATTLVFNPLEGLTPDELNAGQNYFTIQQQNIKNLSTALQCPTL